MVMIRPLSLLNAIGLAQLTASSRSLLLSDGVKDRQKYESTVESSQLRDAFPSERRFWKMMRGNGSAPGAAARRCAQIGSTPSRRPYGQW